MKRDEFLSELNKRLNHIPELEKTKVIDYYKECIDDKIEDGIPEDVAIKSFGNLDNIVNNIEYELPIALVVKDKFQKKTSKNSKTKNIIITILLILGFPIWGSLLLAGASVVLSIYFTAWIVIIFLLGIYLVCAIGGFSEIIFGMISIFTFSPLVGIAYIGAGLVISGIVICLYNPTVWILKKWLYINILPFKKLKQLIIRKG